MICLKKLLKIFFLSLIIVLSFCVAAHAAESVRINGDTYTHGSVTKKNTGGSVGMTGARTAGYTVDFDTAPSTMDIVLGTSITSGNIVEIRLDNSTSGELLAKIDTRQLASSAWGSFTYTVPLTADLSGKHIIYCAFKGGTHDLFRLVFTVPSPDDYYGSFSEKKDAFADISESDYRTDINLLAQLGVIKPIKDDGFNRFDGKALATKRDFINALYTFYGKNASFGSSDIVFSDVSEDDPDYNKIMWLASVGVLKADANSAINPDGAVTLDDALGMLCRLLGYEYRFEAGKSYISIAKSLGLMSGLNQTSSKLRREDMVVLLCNTIESSYDELSGIYTDGGLIFDTKEYILENTGNVYMSEGIVAASYSNNLYSIDNMTPSGEVKIGDVLYSVGKTDAINYLGFKVKFFYSVDGTKKTLLALVPHEDVEYVRIKGSDELCGVSSDYISYMVSDDEEKCSINSSTVVMYNGRPTGESVKSLIGDTKYFSGELLLINNDGDKYFDVIFIEQSETMIFGGVNKSGIYDLITKKVTNIGDIDDAMVFVNGIKSEWSSVKAGSVLDVYISSNKKGNILTRIYVCEDEVLGVIEEIVDGSLVLEDGTQYRPYKTTVKDPDVGMTVVLKLNSAGLYVDYSTEIGEKLALVLNSGANNLEGLSPEVGLRILTEENEITALYFADRVYADGVLVTDAKALWNGTGKFVGGLEARVTENSVVRYALNPDGKITMIDTKEPGAGGVNDTLTLLVSKATSGYNIRKTVITNSSLLELCVLERNYKVIKVDTKAGETAHQFMGAFGQSDTARKLDAYTTKGGTVAADLLVWDAGSAGTTEDHFVLQTKGYTIDADGETAIMLKGISSSGNVTYIIDQNIYKADTEFKAKVDSLLPGDIMQVALTSKKKVSNIAIRYMRDGSESRSNGVVVPSIHSGKHIMERNDAYGKQYWFEVTDRENDILIAKRNNGTVEETFYIDCSGIIVITVDKDGGKYTAELKGSDTSLITVGTQAVACSKGYTYTPYLLVVYK